LIKGLKFIGIFLLLQGYLMLAAGLYFSRYGQWLLPSLVLIWTIIGLGFFDHCKKYGLPEKLFACFLMLQSYLYFTNVIYRSSIALLFFPGVLLVICCCLLPKFPGRMGVFMALVLINLLLAMMPYDLYLRHTGSLALKPAEILIGLPDAYQMAEIRQGNLIWHGCRVRCAYPPDQVFVLTY